VQRESVGRNGRSTNCFAVSWRGRVRKREGLAHYVVSLVRAVRWRRRVGVRGRAGGGWGRDAPDWNSVQPFLRRQFVNPASLEHGIQLTSGNITNTLNCFLLIRACRLALEIRTFLFAAAEDTCRTADVRYRSGPSSRKNAIGSVSFQPSVTQTGFRNSFCFLISSGDAKLSTSTVSVNNFSGQPSC